MSLTYNLAIATILPDHFHHTVLTQRPDPAFSEYVEVDVAGKQNKVYPFIPLVRSGYA